MAARASLPGRGAGNRHGGTEQQQADELIYFKGYQFPMTRSAHADLVSARAESKGTRDAAYGNIRAAEKDLKAAEREARPGSFDRRGAEREITGDWVTFHVAARLGGDFNDTEFMMPRDQAETIMNNPDVSSLNPQWLHGGNTAYFGLQTLPQKEQYEAWSTFSGLSSKYADAVSSAVNDAEASWNTQASTANTAINAAVGEARDDIANARGSVDASAMAEQGEIDRYNTRAKNERTAGKNTAISLNMGG